jgi:hypothetical protein
VEKFPAGAARLVVLDAANPPRTRDPLLWPSRWTVDVPAGGTARVE